MKSQQATFLACAVLVAALPASAAEDADQASAKAGSEKAAASEVQPSQAKTPAVSVRAPARMPIYRPPKVGKPARSVGGGSRGPGDGFPALYALVPSHVGQTASSQPSLFWYVDDAPVPGARMEFTLLDEDGVKPLVEASLEGPKRAGIQRIRLSDYGVQLKPGTEYEWSVALIPDPKERAKDIVATGWIDRVERSGALNARLASEGSARSVYVFADEGLWYDALTALGDQMERNSGDPDLVKIRASLLAQVGLDAVATAPVL
jgi:hypothetical protein